jgi:hypothetical protein
MISESANRATSLGFQLSRQEYKRHVMQKHAFFQGH